MGHSLLSILRFKPQIELPQTYYLISCAGFISMESHQGLFWTAASSFDVKGNKAIKKKFVFLTNRLVFPIIFTYAVITLILHITFQGAFQFL